jgi:hypothetical protein
MTLRLTRPHNPWELQAATRVQNYLARQGWDALLLLCDQAPTPPARVTCLLGERVRFYLQQGDTPALYGEFSYLSEEAALLPLLAEADFGIAPAQLLDRGATPAQVVQRLTAPLTALGKLVDPRQLNPEPPGPSILARLGQDGLFVAQGPAGLTLCQQARDQVTVLGHTAYPWVAALLVGGNLRNIDWAAFN